EHMKFLLFLTKAYKTFACVTKYLPGVIKEVSELTGVTRQFIIALKNIWHL
ncbi:unnamed protein product, partial [marine sediment metagenome]